MPPKKAAGTAAKKPAAIKTASASSKWLATTETKRFGEKIFLLYFPVWVSAVAAVVIFKLYDLFTADYYVYFGLSLAVPCFLLPIIFAPASERALPYFDRYSTKVNVWVAVVTFIMNYFGTHYFYSVIGMRYTVPLDGIIRWELNQVPIVMYLMTHPYFCSYHVLVTPLLRRIAALLPSTLVRRLVLAVVVCVVAYITAFLEAWSISAFPHYWYPDAEAMYKYGSAFYGSMFLITFPMFWRIAEDQKEEWGVLRLIVEGAACSMGSLLLQDFWRLFIGPISPLVAQAVNPPLLSVPLH
eukprot:Colp12_sorted_trinity150504_noHs@740